ncbi:general bacterial porin, GBP family [Pararobbsia alpina]|uniref:porin n=1 Tax=Pararobbsia alpina TaxID=621374 RepID=UPI0039A744D1
MKTIRLAAAGSAALVASVAQAQSSVTLYGILDAGIMYTNNVSKNGSSGHLWQATSGNINGTRFGLRGTEDLGGGLSAIFVLENGFNIQNGKQAQDGRLFGRQSWVGISSTEFGAITLGRQYDFLTDFIEPLTSIAGTFGDTGFIHPFDNDNLDHSVRMNNAVKYTSVAYSGFKFGASYGFSNSTDFAINRAYSAGVSYHQGPLGAGLAYLQINGSAGTSSSSAGAIDINESSSNGTGGFQLGADVERIIGAAVNYALGPALLGFAYTHSQYEGTNSFGMSNGSMHFDNYELSAKYEVTPAVTVGAADTFTDGHLDGATVYGSDPKWNQINLQTVYHFSKRTDVYAEAMYQHVSGNHFVAFVNTAGGASSTGNQVVGTVGLRTRF